MCGGTWRAPGLKDDGLGLSPRVRGNLIDGCANASVTGSIPACAGEPAVSILRQLFIGVYPRVCGGTMAFAPVVWMTTGLSRVCGGTCVVKLISDTDQGLSPRVRGNLRILPGTSVEAGSIPACAGEPGEA